MIPQTLARVPGVRIDVTGMTAGSKDFNDTIKSHLPIVFAFVLGLAFILLLVTFRSIVIPIKAILLNLLSVGAATASSRSSSRTATSRGCWTSTRSVA